MNTRQVSNGAMMTALFYLLIVLDQMSAMLMESYLPYIFALPAFTVSLRWGKATGLTSTFAMIVGMVLFLPFTSWFIIFPFVLCGLLLGLNMNESKRSLWWGLGISFVLMSVVNWVSMVIYPSLFGYEPAEMTKYLGPFINMMPYGWLCLYLSLFLSLMQLITTACLCLLWAWRFFKVKKSLKISVSPRFVTACFWLWNVSLAMLGVSWAMLKTDGIFFQASLLVWFFCSLVLDAVAFRHFAASKSVRSSRVLTFLLCLFAVLPPLCLIMAAAGWIVIIKSMLSGSKSGKA